MEKNSENKLLHKKILLIYNPVAGRTQLKNSFMDVLNIFSEAGCLVCVCGTTKNRSAADIIFEFSKQEFDAVVCCGGDGTLNCTINGMMSAGINLPVGYIPCGTTNDFARGVGIPLNPIKAAEAILSGSMKALDAGSLETKNEKMYFSYIASFGAFTDISYSTPQKAKNMLGHAAYVFGGVQPFLSLFKAPLYHIEAETSQKQIEGDYIFGAVSNSKSIGGIIKLKNKDISLDDGEFEVMFIKKPKNPSQFNELVGKITSGDLRQCPMIDYVKTNNISIKSNTGPWSLDGERVEVQGKIQFRNHQKAIKFLA